MTGAPTAERLAVLLADDPVGAAADVAPELAEEGVRFFAGVDPVFGAGGPQWWFVDNGEVGPERYHRCLA